MEIPIKIIQANKSDLAEIEALQALSFPAEKQQPSHILEESIRKCADTFLLARDENQILGYVLGGPYPHNPQCLEINSLVIKADHQRQGLGTLLLAAMKEMAVELDYKGIRLKSPDELLSYFEMNGFIDEEETDSLYAASQGFSMIWFNPFYLEAQWKSGKQD
ncbi:GNAT family N-acetyltransferase [uncultured Streptococcus sp.]|uniref:GNAT family N-acetyltransferase n=1 Tax=uncultured Streptococcus sp. TaxID=83427 RepID=UPI0028D8E58C|nr:GNAT family N-acetyltransferase [uncultured Streptococcus sp.]